MAAGPGRPVTNEQRIRYQAAINTSDSDCPPFGCMLRDSGTSMGSVDDSALGGDVVGGSWVWHVGRCTATAEAGQRAADFVFAGPEGIRAGGIGRVTEDFPARAMHLKSDVLHSDAIITSGRRYVGPQTDSWLLWDGGTAFRWLGRDDSFQDDDFEAGFVTPAFLRPWSGATFMIYPTNLAQDVDPLASISPSGSGAGTVAWAMQNVSAAEPFSNDFEAGSYVAGGVTYGGIKFNTPGIYSWRFHCSLTSSTAAQGASLVIRSFLDGLSLSPYCYRAMQIEIDSYGAEIQRSVENVAMNGEIVVTADQVLNFRNESAYPISCGASFCTLRRTGP